MKLVGAQEISTFFAGRSKPCGVRFLGRVETAEMNLSMVSLYLGRKSRSFARSSYAARQSRFRSAAVPFVLLVGCFSQVFPAIVSAVTIFVIDRLRPFAGLHSPYHSMQTVMRFANLHEIIAPIRICASRSSASEKRIPCSLRVGVLEMVERARFPGQGTGLRVIVEALAQILCGRQLRHGECIA